LCGAGFPRARSIRNVASFCSQYDLSLIVIDVLPVRGEGNKILQDRLLYMLKWNYL
jgi:hypothetical protein